MKNDEIYINSTSDAKNPRMTKLFTKIGESPPAETICTSMDDSQTMTHIFKKCIFKKIEPLPINKDLEEAKDIKIEVELSPNPSPPIQMDGKQA